MVGPFGPHAIGHHFFGLLSVPHAGGRVRRSATASQGGTHVSVQAGPRRLPLGKTLADLRERRRKGI